MAELTLSPLKRIFKNAGAKRVSDEAMVVLANNLEAQCSIIAENSINMAEHAGRVTVKDTDVKLAVDTLYD